jgi:hypothetical protein
MAPKKSTETKTTPAKRETKKATTPAPVVAKEVTPTPRNTARGTWVSVVADKIDTVMKKPRSWAEWSARQLHENRMK